MPDPTAPEPPAPETALHEGTASEATDAPGRTGRPGRAPQLSPLWFVTGPLLVVLVGAMVLVLAMPVPYFALSPGSARSVEPLITFSGAGARGLDEDPADDDLLFVTVSVSKDRLRGIEAFSGLFQRKVEVVPEVFVIGTSTPDKNRAFNAQLMTDSQDVARKVALERLGYRVRTRGVGTVVSSVFDGFPSSSVLSPGDTITAVDGTAVERTDDLVAAIRAHRPGDVLTLRVLSLGAPGPSDVEVALGSDDADSPRLGVSLQDRVTYSFPLQVDIDSGKVGGPSAGLAFTLAILDRLTPGSLTGDEAVAVTGTIELDGSVGPVGGVDHKAEAAIAAGAELFIVPPDEYEEARRTAGDRLEIRKASTLAQALAILEDVGGDPLPPASASPGAGG